MPPNLETLKKRLENRNTEKKEDLIIRENMVKTEIEHKNKYNYIVINNRLEKTVHDIVCITKEIRRQNEHQS